MTRLNFFNSTIGTFRQLRLKNQDLSSLGVPDFVSASGSKYWYKNDNLYRYSNHWGRVASCVWNIKGKYNAPKNYKLGVIKFKDLEKFEEVYISDYISPRLREVLCVYRNAVPTHRRFFNYYIFSLKARLTFLISKRDKIKYVFFNVGACRGLTCEDFEHFYYIKTKNKHLLKAFVAKKELEILPLVEKEILREQIKAEQKLKERA